LKKLGGQRRETGVSKSRKKPLAQKGGWGVVTSERKSEKTGEIFTKWKALKRGGGAQKPMQKGGKEMLSEIKYGRR